MLIEWFLSIKSLPNLLFEVLCLPGDRSHPVAQPTINPLACCICWAHLLGRAVFPPWNKGRNSGSYTLEKGTVTHSSILGFNCGSVGKESACKAGDLSLIPGLGRSPGEGNCYPLQDFGLENSMDCTVQRVGHN